jgi:hypothetical protein
MPGIVHASMRSPLAVLAVSALLFVFGIGFVIVGAKARRDVPAAAAPAATAAAPIASVRQLMAGIVMPAANEIFQSVQTVVDEKGTHEIQPRTDEEWAMVGASAASLAESGTLLMTDGRALDRGDWIKMSQAMIDAGKVTLTAVESKDPEAVLMAGEVVNASCDACHQRYNRQ